MKRHLLETSLVLLALAAPALGLWLTALWPALLLLLLALLWLWLRPPAREVFLLGSALLAAALILGYGWWQEHREPPARRQWIERAVVRYEQLWQRLGDYALQGRRAIDLPPASAEEAGPQEAFRRLAQVAREGDERDALLLLNPDGEPFAWAGGGLLHDLDSRRPLPASGPAFRASFGAVTMLVIEPLDDSRRPWRVVAGRSFSTAALPFPPPGDEPAGQFTWTLVERADPVLPEMRLLESPGRPVMVVRPRPAAVTTGEVPLARRLTAGAQPLAWIAIGLGLVGLAVMRGVGLVMRSGPLLADERAAEDGPRLRGLGVTLAGLAGAAAWALAATGSPKVTLALVAGLALAAWGLHDYDRSRQFLPVTFKGLAATVLLVAVAWLLQRLDGAYPGPPLDLAAGILASPAAFCLRLALAATACGLFLIAGREDQDVPSAGDGWAWLCALLLAAAAVAHDSWPVALVLLGAAGVTLAVWADQRRVTSRVGGLSALLLLTAVASATAWEVGYRYHLRRSLAERTLLQVAPLSEPERAGLAAEVQDFFRRRELDDLALVDPDQLELQDLPYLIWRDSPLARRNALSALVVRPDRGASASFAYGLSLRRVLSAELPPDLAARALPVWDALRVEGQAEIFFRGRRWGEVQYWLWPRPGIRLGPFERLAEIEVGLLTRGAAAQQQVEGLPESVVYGLYGADGRPLVTPWEEAPPLPAELLAERPNTSAVETPAGNAWVFRRQRADGWEVLYLPVLGPLEALDRVGSHAVGVLGLLAVGALVALLLALPRAPFRELLRRALRSYSKRLLIVYSALLLIPLPLLNVALVAAMEKRLWRQQRLEGESALLAAQHYLGESLRSEPPGFGIDSFFDDRLRWLSSAVRHEINLYYGAASLASSRRELFAAGLLPKRIPGEIFASLVHGGYNLVSRTTTAGDVRYVELYAPLRGPGMPVDKLFLSMPLLAQQEEVAQELTQLRRQSLLVTAVLFGVLVAVGVRLARRFTKPLTELVEGTRRIAAGAPSLDLQPRELELAALAEAVDDMARKVAEGRSRLLREKQVVERMVENVTSGVVSLDHERRVLMHNRVAAALLGVRVSERLDDALAREPRLRPVAEQLRRAAGEPRRATVHLPGSDGTEQEWSVVWVPVPGSGEPSALLVVEDVTEVLRGQRLQAWAEMARIIAHEIKNPLTPIRLSTEHMQLVYASDPEHFAEVFDRCTRNILTQVEELRDIASEFSTYSKIPRIDPQPGDLAAMVAELVDGYRAAPPPGVEVVLELDLELGEGLLPASPRPSLPARFDAKLLSRAVRNLLENAVRASAGGGQVLVHVGSTEGQARIAVTDRGPGVDPALLGRIFDPYFSTHDSGTGLGLPIARRIVEEHGGTIVARNRPTGGLEVTITVPLR